MITFEDQDLSPLCPKCGIRAVKLIALNDNGTGRKLCRDCKREIRKERLKN